MTPRESRALRAAAICKRQNLDWANPEQERLREANLELLREQEAERLMERKVGERNGM